jgi:Holliday junction DNA helicase RuvB
VEYIGQKNIIEELGEAIKTCKQEKKSLPHAIFYGRRGFGKTRLALWVAEQMKANSKMFTGGSLKQASLYASLMDTRKDDIMFIDEIHSVSRRIAEDLYTPMQDFKYVFTYPSGGVETLDIPSFTVLGATTEEGELPSPLLDRFVYQFVMAPYRIEELMAIAKLHATKRFTEDALGQVALLAQGNPRIAKNFVITSELQARGNKVGLEDVERLMEMRQITKEGYNYLQVKYLRLLRDLAKPAGRNTLSTYLGMPETSIEGMLEPIFLEQGLIQRTGRGRIITEKGIALLENLEGNA